jgi:prepilin-type N-terminal cleavage/methylation domain-containing protein
MTRRGMTLIEMLIAMTATLILMAAVAQVFAVFGDAVSKSRSILDSDSKLRVVAWKLRSDLAGATARTLPPIATEAGEGYFEIIEGNTFDSVAVAGGTIGPADCDDVLLFTTRSLGDPFLGRMGSASTSIQSPVAEVAWFARQSPGLTAGIPTFTLYRRQLLVMGYVGTGAFSTTNMNRVQMTWSAYYNDFDVSVRADGVLGSGTYNLYPNTLADLTRRESRFLHNPLGSGSFPFPFAAHQAAAPPDGLIFGPTSPRHGEDIVLSNVLAFDVRVFDPGLPVSASSSGAVALVPGDSGYAPTNPISTGGYVDLGNSPPLNGLLSGIRPHFSGTGQLKSGLASANRRTYDTWSTHYEANGLDDDSDSLIDQGTNGLDDDGDGKFDEPPLDSNNDGSYEDVGELETSPPYPYPLRGLEVRIRCLDPESLQVRQVTVRHTFVSH